MKITISITDGEAALLLACAHQHHASIHTILKEILSVWCAERRAERRYQADPSHYTARLASDDYTDTE